MLHQSQSRTHSFDTQDSVAIPVHIYKRQRTPDVQILCDNDLCAVFPRRKVEGHNRRNRILYLVIFLRQELMRVFRLCQGGKSGCLFRHSVAKQR